VKPNTHLHLIPK